MAKVKVFKAAIEGARLIRREPKAVFAWSGLIFICLGLPFSVMAQVFMQAGEAPVGPGGSVGGLVLLAGFPLLLIAGAVVQVAVVGAVLRAILTPDDRRYFYLRLGKAELWMTLSTVVGAIMLAIVYMVALIAVVLAVAIPLAFLARDAGSMSAVHWAIVLAVMPGYAALLYLVARFGMGAILSFDERRFRLLESWELTAGNGWRLFGLTLLQVVAVWILETLLMLALLGGAAPLLLRPAGDPAVEAALAGSLLGSGGLGSLWMLVIVGSALSGPLLAIFYAPWARAYQMLRGSAA